jgi:hypothetical protein
VNGRVLAALGFVAALIVVAWFGLSEVYDAHLVDDSKRPALFLLIGIIVAFLLIRTNTRMIRARVHWWPGNIEHGDLHVHHALFGLAGMVVAGLVEFTFRPPSPWVELWALTFGAGMGLVLDEFALFLHIEDVYWAEDGRKSIDAVILAIVVVAIMVVGFVPLGLGEEARRDAGPRWMLIAIVAGNLALVVVTFLKGRLWLGVLSLVIPLIAWWGALRIARADSPWAHRWYRDRSDLIEKARRRDAAHERRWGLRKQRLWDLIGGPPHHHKA